jgi:glycosyltransferase involved in cell wall biosynthesis
MDGRGRWVDNVFIERLWKSVIDMIRKIRIMFIIDHLYGRSGGGTENHLYYLSSFLDKERFECLIVAFDTGDTPLTRKIKEQGVQIIHLEVGKYYTLHAIRQAFILADLIRKHQVDIVQTFHFKSDTYAVLVAKLTGCKNIISSKRDVGDTKTKWHYFLNRLLGRFIDYYIVVADRVGIVVSEKEKVPHLKITTIYNGVDVDNFQPPSREEYLVARRKCGISEQDIVFGMVAVFRPEKNHDILLNGFEKSLQNCDNIKLMVVGGGPLLDHYRIYCKKSGLTEKVIFTDATPDVRQYLMAFDVACLVPGSNEGFSNSILEKMSMGLPLIVTDVGGNVEAVINGHNGIVIPPYDSSKLADAIVYLYTHPEKRKEMGMCSRKRIEQKFSLEKMIKNYENYYEVVMRKTQEN